MSQTNSLDSVKIESIFHPSDFSVASEIAFAHALKFALITQARLNMLHVSDDTQGDWHDFPGVRDTLARWKVLPKESPQSAIADLGLDVCKVMAASKDPIKACLGFLEKHPSDLIVLAVKQQEGRMRWFGKSVGAPIARKSGEMTLFIPHGLPGFIAREDGSVSLRSILIPITSKPRPQPALEAAARLIRNLQIPNGTVTLLHVGSPGEAPSVQLPGGTGWSWNQMTQSGDPTEVILQMADKVVADLILMTTDGPDGFLDGLRGSTFERVLRKAPCPVANLPLGSLLG